MIFERYGDHRELHVLTHSFPTRRSSDLIAQFLRAEPQSRGCVGSQVLQEHIGSRDQIEKDLPAGVRLHVDGDRRSEEHTSELQSLMRISSAVFCLKKKISSLSFYSFIFSFFCFYFFYSSFFLFFF